MAYPTGYLKEHPVPPGVTGALGLGGYQLLVDVAGVGTGRLGSHIFLVVAPEPDTVPDGQEPATHLVLHQSRLRGERDAGTFVALAGQLGYLRLSGYRLLLERNGLRSRLNVVNPATGGIALAIPDKHPGGLFGKSTQTASSLLATASGLPAAGPPPDLGNPEMLEQALLTLALGDDSLDAASAVGVADRALQLVKANRELDPAVALATAKEQAAGTEQASA